MSSPAIMKRLLLRKRLALLELLEYLALVAGPFMFLSPYRLPFPIHFIY
jgi:hypothetical protein